jgi:hypothetical protein
MEYSSLIAPVVALVAWSLVVMLWMAMPHPEDEESTWKARLTRARSGSRIITII